ncbi:hypothetical protein F4813DRAFT_401221 [Daldinia decipiens]|uniref:uncharacterized protein n=1 Tax=Daldinia decipiens TaxID=326647 RepID=UPI0020C590DA|nr:uncharacterized protein F4813DRAFT_401221 [Daldinia decipiens]KAI1660282.1 hypothetical protein F4813DRAFT_401221 [Daldinia decipiens]
MPRGEACTPRGFYDIHNTLEEGETIDPESCNAHLPPGVTEDIYSSVRNTPPPGIVRAYPPKPISYAAYRKALDKVRVITNDDVSVFGDIAHYVEYGLDSAGRRVELYLTCHISQTVLDVTSKTPRSRDLQDTSRSEPMAVLPCGHFFGFRGIDDWVRTRYNDNVCPDCPLCRFLLVYPQCGHEIRIRPYDPRFTRDGQLPLTIPEGGSVPDYCLRCRVDYLKLLGQQIAHQVYPDDIPFSAFTNPNRCGPVHFENKRIGLQDYLLDVASMAEGEFSHW